MSKNYEKGEEENVYWSRMKEPQVKELSLLIGGRRPHLCLFLSGQLLPTSDYVSFVLKTLPF